MGTWSHESFGNDTACDWAYELEGITDLSVIESTIDRVLESEDEYLEAPDAEEAIAAIEVIAKLLGNGTQSDSYTERADAWVKENNLRPSAELIQKARNAISKILSENSELAELWEESEEWKPEISKLLAAISK
jgi:hypothetical protein